MAPNIILIMCDDDPVSSLAGMPKTQAKLVDYGTSFSNCYVTTPSCTPARASILTGMYTHNHKVQTNKANSSGGWQTYRRRGWEQNSLPRWLKAAGYLTAHFGKYLNEYGMDNKHMVPPYWDRWFTFLKVGYFDYDVNVDGHIKSYGDAAKDYSTDVCADMAHTWLATRLGGDKPLFCMLSPKASHVGANDLPEPAPRHNSAKIEPFVRPPSFDEANMTDKPQRLRKEPRLSKQDEAYCGQLWRRTQRTMLSVDDAIADLVDLVAAKGEMQNTVFILTSENGRFYGEHRQAGGKGWAYEGAGKVYLVMAGPGIPANTKVDKVVSHVDLTATIVALAGLMPTHDMDGSNLLPLMNGDALDWRDTALVEYMPLGYQATRTANLKYIKHNTGEQELYDLAVDPDELVNVAKDPGYSAQLAAIKDIHDGLAECRGADCRSVTHAV